MRSANKTKQKKHTAIQMEDEKRISWRSDVSKKTKKTTSEW